ncbi:MAG: ATPase, T2SS/T4P/T4SS family [Candidatus Woesearchaeota archaeon]
MRVDSAEINEILEIESDEYSSFEFLLPKMPDMKKLAKEYTALDKPFDRLRIKHRLFTKEYDRNGTLLSLEPFFIDVRFVYPPKGSKLIEQYKTSKGSTVQIYLLPDEISYMYYLKIPEMHATFTQIEEFERDVQTYQKEGETSSPIVYRWYRDFGILEYLLYDEQLLEVNVNPPAYKTSIRIVHAKYDECISNIYPSDEFLNYLSMRLKTSTGRPFNKAQPQLDGEIKIGKQRARVAAIMDPFSVYGTAYSIRKHREDPWTLPLFLKNETVNDIFAGFMSLLISHGRSFLVAGPRGSGKTSVLGALLLELLPKYRLITIEDTQELPVDSYKKMGYDIVPLKVRSALSAEGFELPFDTGLRTSLRLGDSCLILGEIRSKEAKVLYEAMRVGAMSNVVAGTIHGDSPYGVYDRVVNDLGVPPGSFKVTDVIIIANQIKLPGGQKRVRRILRVTEVLKDWKDEPVFQDLLVWNAQTDKLEPTKELLEGKSVVLNQIMSVSKGYKTYDDILKEIRLRAWTKNLQIQLAKRDSHLEGKFVMPINILFTKHFAKILPLESEKQMKTFMTSLKKDMERLFFQREVDPKQFIKKNDS